MGALPGVGAYTAAAVAAIAFDARATPVDGNVARILARLHAFEAPIAQARPAIRAAAAALTPAKRPGDFAQALMDIGALICRPRNPDCPACPLLSACAAARAGAPEAYPRRARREAEAGPRRRGFLRPARGRRAAGAPAPSHGAAGRTLELPGGPWEAAERAAAGPDQAPFAASWRRLPGEIEHVFTHFTLRLTLYAAEVGSIAPEPQGLIWIEAATTQSAGFSSLMLKAVAHARRFA